MKPIKFTTYIKRILKDVSTEVGGKHSIEAELLDTLDYNIKEDLNDIIAALKKHNGVLNKQNLAEILDKMEFYKSNKAELMKLSDAAHKRWQEHKRVLRDRPKGTRAPKSNNTKIMGLIIPVNRVKKYIAERMPPKTRLPQEQLITITTVLEQSTKAYLQHLVDAAGDKKRLTIALYKSSM